MAEEEEPISERQDNEIEVLKAIFGDDLVDLREKDVWKVRRPPEIVLKLAPLKGSSGNTEVHAQVDMTVKCTHRYPLEVPAIKLDSVKGLSKQIITDLTKQLQNFAMSLRGEVMILELADFVRKYLYEYNMPRYSSFYEEMMSNQKKHEAEIAKVEMRKQEYSRLKQEREKRELDEEIERRQAEMQKLKAESKQNRISPSILINPNVGLTVPDNASRSPTVLEESPKGSLKHGTPTRSSRITDNEQSGDCNEIPIIWGVGFSGQSRLKNEFEVLQFLGKGGFGDVIKARNKLDGSIYAIKRIPLNPKCKQLNKKITREVQLLSRLNHENVVRYYNSWIETGEVIKNFEEDELGSLESRPSSAARNVFRQAGQGEPMSKFTPYLPEGAIEWSVSDDLEQESTQALADMDDDDDDEDGDDINGTFERFLFPFDDESTDSVVFDYGNNQQAIDSLQEESSWTQDKSFSNSGKQRNVVQFMYIQMEYCEKSTLRTCIDDGLYENIERRWKFFRELIEGLLHIHQQGMIHRDLKPVNIFLDLNDHVKIGDFGLATTDIMTKSTLIDAQANLESEADTCQPELQELTSKVGTALYTSPELMSCSTSSTVSYTQKVDIYSLGIIFFEMCNPPLSTAMERVKVISDLRRPDIIFPENFDQTSAEGLIIRWLLNHDPKQRPTLQQLLLSDYLPPPQLEEAELNEVLRHTISNKNSAAYRRLMGCLFAQSVTPTISYTYDLFLHKGAFAYMPAMITRQVHSTVVKIFEKHGAIEVNTPLFLPSDPLWQKQELGVHVIDCSGLVVDLPYDLRVPFARYVAKNNVTSLKRYNIGKVYRERKRLNFGSHPRELTECAFDIVTSTAAGLIPDAEVLSVVCEIVDCFPVLQSRGYIIKINHTLLLKSLLMHCGIAEQNHKDVLSILENFGKLSKDMLETRLYGLSLSVKSVESLCNYMEIEEDCKKISCMMRSITKRPGEAGILARQALRELDLISNYLTCFGGKLQVLVKLSLMFNVHYYSGMFFQVVSEHSKKKKQMRSLDILACGGRYDNLIKKYTKPHSSSNISQFVVGVSIELEKLIGSAKEQEDFTPSGIYDILVCSVGNASLIREKIALVKELWAIGLRVDLQYEGVRDLEELHGFCKKSGVSHLVILKDTESGLVKVRSFVKDRMVDKKMTYAELKEMLQPKAPLALKHTSSDLEQHQKVIGQNSILYNHRFLYLEKVASNQKRMHERQLSAHIVPILQKVAPRSVVEVVATELPASVVKTVSSSLDMQSESTFNESTGIVMQKHQRYKKYLNQVLDVIHELYFEKEASMILLYSVKDDMSRCLL